MAKKNEKITSYEEAMIELQEIVRDIQEETVNMDDLSNKVKRSAELIQFCKERLRSTEEEIGKSLLE